MPIANYQVLTESNIQKLAEEILTKTNLRIDERFVQSVNNTSSVRQCLSASALHTIIENLQSQDNTNIANILLNTNAIDALEDRVTPIETLTATHTTDITTLNQTVAGIRQDINNSAVRLSITTVTGDIATTVTTPDSSVLYFQRDNDTDTTWELYIYDADHNWINIGNTEVDLSNYWQKTDVAQMRIDLGINDVAMDAALSAPIESPTFTGLAEAPTPAAGDNSTAIATTEFTYNAIQDATISDLSIPTDRVALVDSTDTISEALGKLQFQTGVRIMNSSVGSSTAWIKVAEMKSGIPAPMWGLFHARFTGGGTAYTGQYFTDVKMSIGIDKIDGVNTQALRLMNVAEIVDKNVNPTYFAPEYGYVLNGTTFDVYVKVSKSSSGMVMHPILLDDMVIPSTFSKTTTEPTGIVYIEPETYVTQSDLNALSDIVDTKAGIDYVDLMIASIPTPTPLNSGLSESMNYYVDAINGDDTNTGTDSLAPLHTITAAVNKVPKNLNGYNVIINIAAGNYDESVRINGINSGNIMLVGAGVDVTNIGAVYIANASTVLLSSFTIKKILNDLANVNVGLLNLRYNASCCITTNISIDCTGYTGAIKGIVVNTNSALTVTGGQLTISNAPSYTIAAYGNSKISLLTDLLGSNNVDGILSSGAHVVCGVMPTMTVTGELYNIASGGTIISGTMMYGITAIPTSPVAGNNTTQLATTEFVNSTFNSKFSFDTATNTLDITL